MTPFTGAAHIYDPHMTMNPLFYDILITIISMHGPIIVNNSLEYKATFTLHDELLSVFDYY